MKTPILNLAALKTVAHDEELFIKAIAKAADLHCIREYIKASSDPMRYMGKRIKATQAYWAAKGVKFNTPDTTANTSNNDNAVVGVFVATDQVDFGYERIFDLVDMRASTNKTFEIQGAANVFSFPQRLPGEEINFKKLSDSKSEVSYLEFADGVSVLDIWKRFQEIYLIEDVLRQASNKYQSRMATLHYALLEALGSGVNQAFDTDVPTSIDNAAGEILNDTKDKGYFVGEGVGVTILVNPRLRRQIMDAIDPVGTNAARTTLPVVQNINEVIFTSFIPKQNASSKDQCYVVLPGNRLKRGVWDDMTTETGRSVQKSGDDIAFYGRYNAAIGDTDQVKRVALEA